MGNNDLSNNENILVKVDQNNLIYVDPNSVINDGEIEPRGIKQENLVMYVNLEADLIPRSSLISENNSATLVSVAKGTMNFLSNQKKDESGNIVKDFDTSWTDSFFNFTETQDKNGERFSYQSDSTAQTLGIDAINITTKGFNAIPQVTISFIDVRGKTLFESPENSPYRAFFHLPWPIFYLTVKGFYGKAIRYRLHLVKFNTRLNESNGNFEITGNFVGSTYAYLNDIPLNGMLNAPYMYMVETSKDGKVNLNPDTEQYEQKISKSSKGYQLLNSVYNEYKQKGLIDQNFPVKTLRELIVISESIEGILEREIFDQVIDQEVFAAIVSFEKNVTDFYNSVVNWGRQNLSPREGFTGTTNNQTFYYYINGNDKTVGEDKITGQSSNSLEQIIKTYKSILDSDQSLSKLVIKRNKIGVDFSSITANKYVSNKIGDYYSRENGNNKIGVALDLLVNHITKIINEFSKQKQELQLKIEEKMNEVLKRDNFLGFEPTVRNIFAVVLANADVYIRLLKDVHNKAFEQGVNRRDIIGGLSDETPKEGSVYPWPEIKKSVGGGTKNKVLVYPGDDDIIRQLQSDDKTLWPEVDFVENYQAISTKKFDTLSEKEGGVGNINYVFSSDIDESKVKKISTLNTLTYGLPYINKTLASILYEIFERSFYITSFDTFNNNTINELSKIEFENIKESIREDYDIVSILKNNVKDINDLYNKMKGISPFERFPYLKDQLPTVPYIKDLLSTPFSIEQYYDDYTGNTRNGQVIKINNDDDYTQLTLNLKQYEPETHRINVYPYNSNLYLSYIKQSTFKRDEFKFNGILSVDTFNGFITSPVDPKGWVKKEYVNNIFGDNLRISGSSINILNTPYFHKQLLSDFANQNPTGKYVGSAYLLINSLPFNDLEDIITLDGKSIRMSSLFREIGSTHTIPYHLIVKWGSIYHRYKKYILDGEDILDDVLTNLNKTTPFDGELFFNNNQTGSTFTINSTTINHNGNDVGIHPYYDAIYHQIINGYNHYDILSGDTSFSVNVIAGGIVPYSATTNGVNYWTTYVDNSKYVDNTQQYTIIPSNGFFGKVSNDSFLKKEQRAMRVIWSNENNLIDFSGLTFNSPLEYSRSYNTGQTSIDNLYSINVNYRKVLDLIATFSPQILEQFEDIFIRFATSKINEDLTYKRFNNVDYYHFQDILKDVSVVEKKSGDLTSKEDTIRLIIERQSKNLGLISNRILSNRNLISLTIANPKEIDQHVIYGFADINNENTFSYNSFNVSQISSNSKYIDLYVGEDIDNRYLQFFATNDIELNEENVLNFRPLILLFAGYYKSNPNLTPTESGFKSYLRDTVYLVDSNTKLTLRQSLFLKNVIQLFGTLEEKTTTQKITETRGYGNETLKLELYNYFKSFNDKWIAGNSIGQRLLLEEFLFLDKANRDIGSQVYFNLQRLTPLGDVKNQKSNLYSVISMLIQGTGFDMRPLPSYINFYGANYNNKIKQTPSKNLAKNLFGTFLEVDYQESTPKVIIQYTGPTSKHLDLSKYSKEYKYADDSFYIGNVNKNPLIITTPEVFNNNELYKSNRVVAFEVSFGDQNQSIFKGIQLDQSSIRNTTESMIAMENLGRSESGSSTYQVDIGLFDIYRQASYSCTVTAMGNVMIQPTMYFYLKNVPMFKGTYWITDVAHSIKNNNIVTSFTGTRIPSASLPDPKDSLMSSYKPLFDAITNKAIARINSADRILKTESSVTLPDGTTQTIDLGDSKPIPGEILISESGFNKFGIPYNGYLNMLQKPEKYIQKIRYQPIDVNGFGRVSEWLRTRVVLMGGENYQIPDDREMSLYSYNGTKLTWGEIRKTDIFFSSRFLLHKVTPDKILVSKTRFFNPINRKLLVLESGNNLNSTPKKVQGPINVGPPNEIYGIGMSKTLMSNLGLKDGDVVYFEMV